MCFFTFCFGGAISRGGGDRGIGKERRGCRTRGGSVGFIERRSEEVLEYFLFFFLCPVFF
jgi:hypothetical protein